MKAVTSKISGLSVAMFIVSLAGTGHAFTWGRLAKDLCSPDRLGDCILALVEAPGPDHCSAKVPENLEAYTITSDSDGNVTESAHVWGQAAKDLLMANSMPYEIDDDGYQTCAKYYDDEVTLKFAAGSSVYRHSYVGEYFYRIPMPDTGLLIWLSKWQTCSGHNNFHASMGTGGSWGSWGIYANYYKSF